jgi:hypothetical protein
MDEVALESGFLRVLCLSPDNHLLHTYLSLPHDVSDSPDQAAHQFYAGGFVSDPAPGWSSSSLQVLNFALNKHLY